MKPGHTEGTERHKDLGDDVQQLVVVEEEVPPEQQEWSPSLDQEDPPEPPHIKEEQDAGDSEDDWAETSSDIQQLVVIEEEVPAEQHEWSPSLDQEDPPEPPHIKEEQEELWISHEEVPYQGLEEAEITKKNIEVSKTVDKPFICFECGRRFAFKSILKRHMIIHTGQRPFSCSICGKSFTEKGNLTLHMAVHTGEKRFSCSFCDQRFLWHNQLRRHECVGRQSSQLHQKLTEGNRGAEPGARSSSEQMETGADGEDCGGPETDPHLKPGSEDSEEPQSGSTLIKNRDASKFDKRCNTDENQFSCSICGKAFTRKRNLTQHMTVHKGDKPFSCSLCGKSFKRKADMRKHEAVHTGEDDISCSICGKSFRQKGKLTQHMAIHAAETQFNYSVCDGTVTQNGTSTGHLAIHTRVLPFSCPFCGKTFKWKAKLIEHMVVHTGEKRFSCSVCGKRFTLKGYLRQHMAIHTGEKRFSCTVCEQSFTWDNQLQKHKLVCPQSYPSYQLLLNQTEEITEAEPGAGSSTEQMETGADGEDCGGPEPARNLHPDTELGPDTADSDDYSKETRRPQSGLKSPKNYEVSKSDMRAAKLVAGSSNEQMETGAVGEDCGGPEPARNSHPDTHLQTETKDKTED